MADHYADAMRSLRYAAGDNASPLDAQLATAQAVLAVVDELRELRRELSTPPDVIDELADEPALPELTAPCRHEAGPDCTLCMDTGRAPTELGELIIDLVHDFCLPKPAATPDGGGDR